MLVCFSQRYDNILRCGPPFSLIGCFDLLKGINVTSFLAFFLLVALLYSMYRWGIIKNHGKVFGVSQATVAPSDTLIHSFLLPKNNSNS